MGDKVGLRGAGGKSVLSWNGVDCFGDLVNVSGVRPRKWGSSTNSVAKVSVFRLAYPTKCRKHPLPC